MTLRSSVRLIAMLGIALATSMVAFGQQGAPRTVSATPRLSDGHPDLNGLWYRRVPPVPPVERQGKTVVLKFGERDPNAEPSAIAYSPGKPPYKPELLAKVKQLADDAVNTDPAGGCGPPGLPRIGPPQRIFHSPKELVILYEDLNGNFFRVVPIDGRPHRTNIERSSLGDSVGHWENDTLVLDTTNFSEESWLDDEGLFHSKDLHVTERLTRRADTLEWQPIVEDPGVFTSAWKQTPRVLKMLTGIDIEESAPCVEQSFQYGAGLHRNTR